MSLVVAGRILPLSANREVASSEFSSFRGKVWIGDNGRIAAITQGTKKGPPGFEGAPVVDVGTDLVVPGFIDLHSHLAYATLPLWVEPNRTVPFLHHDVWPSRPTYASSVTWPAYAFIEAAPAELLAYAEVRALIGGTTSIQGSPPSNRPLDGWLVRNVEDETLGGAIGANQVLASTLTLKPEMLGDRAEKMRAGATFIYHCAEGQPGSLVKREYLAAFTTGCLQASLVAIHTNAVDAAGYAQWTDVGAVVWSPFSNLWLYGTTTDVPAARAQDIHVCLGSDWGPSGMRNVLGELKVAALVNARNGWKLSDRDLVRMITSTPGDVLARAWGAQVGRLQPDALADLVIVGARPRADPFKTIVNATEDDVRLVVIGGRPSYGDVELMSAAGAKPVSPLFINGKQRSLALTRIDQRDEAWSFDQVTARLEEVRANPKAAIEASGRRAFAAIRAGAPPPLRLALDMPTGLVPIGGLPRDLGQIQIPPLQALAHDAAFFAGIPGRGFHGGLLDGLAAFYD